MIVTEKLKGRSHHARNVAQIVVGCRIRNVHSKLEIPTLCGSLLGIVPLDIILICESMPPAEDGGNILTVCQ